VQEYCRSTGIELSASNFVIHIIKIMHFSLEKNNLVQGERSIKKSDIFKGPIINLTYNYTENSHRFPFQLIRIAYKSLKVPYIYFFTKVLSFIF